MKSLSGVMNYVRAYVLWQTPFAEKKLAPVRQHNDLGKARSVLDVGCGPGTNTRHLNHSEYLGLDWNQSYVDYANRRFGREFIVTDVCSYQPAPGILYDFILVNSFLHHIDDDNTLRILSKLKRLLTEDGHVHVLDLVMPDSPCIARLLAQWDRGDFARSLEKWRSLLTVDFEPVIVEPYPLTAFGITLWKMFYFKGKARK
jgi:SAM-dependent methyltransferase